MIETNHPEKRIKGGTVVGLVEEVKEAPAEEETSSPEQPEQPKPKRAKKKQ